MADMMDERYNVVLPDGLVERVQSTFPEQEEIEPSLISADKDANVHLLERAEIEAVFIDEGAGYKNSFGYFLYHEENGGIVIDETVKIYDNASKQGAGGQLVAGDTVNLGVFEAGTRMGFFLGANEYNGGTNRFYSIDGMNADGGLKHTAMVLDYDSQMAIIGFEDLWGGGDEDYNDMVFTLKVTPFRALDRSKLGSNDVLEPGVWRSRCFCG
jgi:hypothetical protein